MIAYKKYCIILLISYCSKIVVKSNQVNLSYLKSGIQSLTAITIGFLLNYNLIKSIYLKKVFSEYTACDSDNLSDFLFQNCNH